MDVIAEITKTTGGSKFLSFGQHICAAGLFAMRISFQLTANCVAFPYSTNSKELMIGEDLI